MTMQFGLRGRLEHCQMLWGDVELNTDFVSGREYLQLTEQFINFKRRQGPTRCAKASTPRIYATGTASCPVVTYKEYARRRPAVSCRPDARFYLQPVKNPQTDTWFSHLPIGKNAIGNLAANMAKKANLTSSRITNFSACKTAHQTVAALPILMMHDDSCVMNYIEIVPLDNSADTPEFTDFLSSSADSPELPDSNQSVQVKVEPDDVLQEREEEQDNAVNQSPPWNTRLPSPAENVTSVNDVCEQRPHERDAASNASHSPHSNEVDTTEGVDVKEEIDDALFSEISHTCSAGYQLTVCNSSTPDHSHRNSISNLDTDTAKKATQLPTTVLKMLRGANVQQIDDTEHDSNTCDQIHRDSFSNETDTAEKSHECDLCHKRFKYPAVLLRHKLTHIHGKRKPADDTAEKSFECDLCHKMFKFSSHLSIHKELHFLAKPYSKTFERRSDGVEHSRDTRCRGNHAEQRVIQRRSDQTAYGDIQHRSGHTRCRGIHARVKPHVCEVCDKAFLFPSLLNTHRLVHTGAKPYVCDQCHKTFKYPFHLSAHRRIHTGGKAYVCKTCDRAFTEASSLRRHQYVHSDVKQFKCDVCWKAFKHLRGLSWHRRSHSTVKALISDKSNMQETGCPLVTFTAATDNCVEQPDNTDTPPNVSPNNVANNGYVNVKQEDNDNLLSSFISGQLPTTVLEILRDADVEQTDDTEQNSNTCDQMHRNSVYRETHTAKKLLECDLCHKTFKYRSKLLRHKFIHASVKPYVCYECGLGFCALDRLKRHMYIHSGLRPYTCDICGKTCKQIPDLNKHKLTHSAVKPYVCYVCSKAFTKANDLKKHVYVHSGIKRFACDRCGNAFMFSADLSRHKRIRCAVKPLSSDVYD